MANPNYDQRRREAANEGRLHEHREVEMDWTDRDERSGRSGGSQGESDQHHHHHGGENRQSHRDYEQVAEQAHTRLQSAVGDQSDQHRQRRDDRRYGQRREQRGREGREQGSPHEGSQRGSHREEGLSGRIVGQRGRSSHHADPSDSTFRGKTTGRREHRHGGERGTSERDRRYGSRRGHGSERETERRRSSQ